MFLLKRDRIYVIQCGKTYFTIIFTLAIHFANAKYELLDSYRIKKKYYTKYYLKKKFATISLIFPLGIFSCEYLHVNVAV